MKKKNDPVVGMSDNLQLLLKHYSMSLRELGRVTNVNSSHLSKISRKVVHPSIVLVKK